jgi:FAD/FMN-containing dehydrogenase
VTRDDPLVRALTGALGAEHVLTAPDLRAPYEIDWTRRFSGHARCVARPSNTEQVATVLRLCAEADAPVVPQGGNTGLVGGAVPRGGDVVVSLTRLDDLEPVDRLPGEVTVGAGVTLGRLQAHADAAGLAVGVDLAARDSATVGGMIATNAGGLHAWRHGAMRAHVVGLEAVLADGQVVRRLPGVAKDNTGYDLPGLLTGSEGTLGVITRARLRLVPVLHERVVALLAVADTAAALAVFARLRDRVASLHAAELFHAEGLALVRAHTGAPAPFPDEHPVYVLVECAARHDPTEELAAALADADEVRAVAVAQDRPGRERLWSLRERHTEAINAAGVPHKLDVGLPLTALPDFARRVRSTVASVAPSARVLLFGHLGDGNLHVNLLGLAPDDEIADDAVLRLVAELGGSISAEHGIGVAKARWLGLTRSDADVAAMTAIKQALDPRGVLNPGVLLPAAATPRP